MALHKEFMQSNEQRIMKLRRLFFVALIMGGCWLVTACSSDNNSGDMDRQSTAEALQFSITESDFNADEELKTRAEQEPSMNIDTIDLGNGIEAVASIQQDTAKQKSLADTRSVLIGHYTVRAYQSGVQKGEWKGTFDGSTFTPDASTSREVFLAPGTYDFVCFNDKVTVNGNNLVVNQYTAGEARIGANTGVVISGKKQQVPLIAKHVTARVNTQVKATFPVPSTLKGGISSSSNDFPQKVSYNPATNAYTTTETGWLSGASYTYPAATMHDWGTVGYYAIATSNEYAYFFPGIDASKLSFEFQLNGLIIGNRMLTLSNTKKFSFKHPVVFAANKSYTIILTLNLKFKYLFQDGTTDYLRQGKAAGKTPIAVVVDEDRKIAMALKDANGGAPIDMFTSLSNAVNSTRYAYYNSTYMNQNAMDDEGGYRWTWLASGSSDHTTIKADDQTRYPGFYAAGHYDPGVTVTGANVGKWYIPAFREWINALSGNCFLDSNIPDGESHVTWNDMPLSVALTQAGGTSLYGKEYLSSTMSAGDNSVYGFNTTVHSELYIRRQNPGYSGQSAIGLIRPFIRY